MGGEEGTLIEGQCGVDGLPHRLRSCNLAGKDNYTAVWNKVCTAADSSYATQCIVPSGWARNVPRETKNNVGLLSCGATSQNHYNYLMHTFNWMSAFSSTCEEHQTHQNSLVGCYGKLPITVCYICMRTCIKHFILNTLVRSHCSIFKGKHWEG